MHRLYNNPAIIPYSFVSARDIFLRTSMLSSITIKRNKHWLYHCEPSRKQEMLAQLIAHYADKSILIAVSHKENFSLEVADNITVMSDDEIMNVDAQQFDLIIHGDLPAKASQYIKRLSCAKELSIGLLLPEEAQLLYQIETLFGRTIPQKYLEGFEPVKTVQEEFPKQSDRTSKNRSEYNQKPRYEKKRFSKPADPDKRRQRNHHQDGTVRTEEERAEYQSRRTQSGKKHKFNHDKKGADEKSSRKPFSDKKKYDKKERSENKVAQPKRKPRTFNIKASKKDGDK